MKYSIVTSIVKGIKYPVLVVIGLLITGFQITFPDIFNLSIGGGLIVLYDLLKHKLGVRLF